MPNPKEVKEMAVLKECKKKVYDMIEPYIKADEQKNSKKKSGTLRYLQGLFICSVAVSNKSRKEIADFRDFIDTNILCSEQEVLSYFDCGQNITAFRAWEGNIPETAVYHESFGYPRFLLMQKAREVKDRALLKYINLGEFAKPSDIKKVPVADREKIEDQTWEKKETAHLKWLQSVAFFEICVRNYFGEINQMMSDTGIKKAVESLEELQKRIEESEPEYDQWDSCRKEEWDQKTMELFEEFLRKCDETYYKFSFFDYFWILVHDLFATLNLVTLVEYVNVNVTTARNGIEIVTDGSPEIVKNMLKECYATAYSEATFLEDTVWKLLNDTDDEKQDNMQFTRELFMAMNNWNRNYAPVYKTLNNIAQKVYLPRKIALTSKLGEQAEGLDALKEYIDILEKKYGSENISDEKTGRKQKEKISEEQASEGRDLEERELEKHLQGVQMQLAQPMYKVIDRETSGE